MKTITAGRILTVAGVVVVVSSLVGEVVNATWWGWLLVFTGSVDTVIGIVLWRQARPTRL